jgi:hypothetical protein
MRYIITEEQFSTIQTNNPGSILRMIEKIYNSMNMEGVCEMDLGYDEEDNNFHCYLVIDKDWYLDNNFISKELKNVKIHKYAKELKEKINNYLGITMFVGHYVSPLPCE